MELPPFLTLWPYNEIVLTGHRIGLYTVIRHYKDGWSAEQIVEEYPSLRLDHVRQVIGFYLENREEVDRYVKEYAEELDRQEREYQPGPGHLRILELMKRIEEGDVIHQADPEWSKLSAMQKLTRLGLATREEPH